MTRLTCLEICAGAGGQSYGLEQAGFEHLAAVEIDPDACETLRLNRPNWTVVQSDARAIDGTDYEGVTLLAGGVPCPSSRRLGPKRCCWRMSKGWRRPSSLTTGRPSVPASLSWV